MYTKRIASIEKVVDRMKERQEEIRKNIYVIGLSIFDKGKLDGISEELQKWITEFEKALED